MDNLHQRELADPEKARVALSLTQEILKNKLIAACARIISQECKLILSLWLFPLIF